jgi:hypothetical protein
MTQRQMREQRFTKEMRQKIVEEFAKAHGGAFDAAAFLGEVQQVGEKHPAYGWFEWNKDRAAREYRLDQARDFARGLVIHFEVEKVERGRVKLVTATAPMILSPLAKRDHGGGYFTTDPNDPAHMAELCRQAAQSMRWYISRFSGAVTYAGGEVIALRGILNLLDRASSAGQPEAAE